MSGISMIFNTTETEKRHNKRYSGMVADTMSEYQSEFFNLDLMFNAYHEDKMMDEYLSKYNYFGATWYADSGGLQMVTLGKEITEEAKDKIYEMQAKHSDYAMCFDEMPIKLHPNKSLTTEWNKKGRPGKGQLDVQDLWGRDSSSRTDLSYRSYIAAWNEAKARQTGRNVKRQIEVIRKNNSKTKVFLICQGNDLCQGDDLCQDDEVQDFVDYYNFAVEELDASDYPYIAGVALSIATAGRGTKEYIKMLASYAYMDIKEGMGNKVHLLGFGSATRVKRSLALCENFIDADITFDSSSHTMNVLTGTVEFEDGKKAYGKNLNKIKEENHKWYRNPNADEVLIRLYNKYEPIFTRYYPDMCIDKFLEIVGYDFETSERFHRIISPPEMIEKYDIDIKTSTTIHLYKRFLDAFESFSSFSKKIKNELDVPNHLIRNLKDIKTIKDFEEFQKTEVYWKLDSNPIERYDTEAEADAAQHGCFGDFAKGVHLKPPKKIKDNYRERLPGF